MTLFFASLILSDDLLYVTEENTDATWGFVKAKLALMKAKGELNTEQYEAGRLHGRPAFRSNPLAVRSSPPAALPSKLALMKAKGELNTEQYEAALHNIEAMRDTVGQEPRFPGRGQQ